MNIFEDITFFLKALLSYSLINDGFMKITSTIDQIS